MRRLALIAGLALALSFAGDARGQAGLGTLEELDAQITGKERSISEADVRRDRIGAEIDALVGQRDTAQRRMRVRVRALYRLRRAGVLPLAGGFEALIRHQSRIERLERMVGRDIGSLRTLSRRVSALQGETSRLASEVEVSEREIRSLRERKAALERATIGMWAGVVPQSAPPASLGEAPWSEGIRIVGEEPRASFEGMRGRLPMPVGGSARVGNAEREGGEGVELFGSAGIAVRAVAPGTVSYAASHPAYGNLVIVDHGGSYYTVYGSLGSIATRVGQPVNAQGAVGSVGPQAVFFQVRRGTRPLPAREWLGL